MGYVFDQWNKCLINNIKRINNLKGSTITDFYLQINIFEQIKT